MCKLNFCQSCVILKLNCIVTRGINSILQNFSYQKSNHRVQILAKTLLIRHQLTTKNSYFVKINLVLFYVVICINVCN